MKRKLISVCLAFFFCFLFSIYSFCHRKCDDRVKIFSPEISCLRSLRGGFSQIVSPLPLCAWVSGEGSELHSKNAITGSTNSISDNTLYFIESIFFPHSFVTIFWKTAATIFFKPGMLIMLTQYYTLFFVTFCRKNSIKRALASRKSLLRWLPLDLCK